jgi:hypothetical protein
MSTTLDYPGTLAQAIISPDITPGDRLLLRTHTYSADYSVSLEGVQDGVIAILPYTGDAPIINGSIYIHKPYVTLQSLVISDADFTTRETQDTGSAPADIPTHDGVRIETPAQGASIINAIIHDCRQGTLKDVTIPYVTYYGSLIYYNGWSAPNRGHGHGIYAANGNDTPLIISDCIIHSNFGYNLHSYGETSGGVEILKNIRVEGLTTFGSFDGNIIGGSGNGATVRTSWIKNSCLKDNLNIGFVLAGCTDFILTGNVIIGNLTMLFYGATPTITGNKFYGTVAITNGDTSQLLDAPTVFPNNEYLSAFPNHVDLRANAYDANRAKLTIFNGSEAASVSVDVSAIFGQSGTVQARNVQDYFTDIQTLTITGGSMTVNMQAMNRTVAAPQGWTAPATTFPSFGCFILERQ